MLVYLLKREALRKCHHRKRERERERGVRQQSTIFIIAHRAKTDKIIIVLSFLLRGETANYAKLTTVLFLLVSTNEFPLPLRGASRFQAQASPGRVPSEAR